MPLYSKSKQIVTRSWRRISDSIRYMLGSIYIYDIHLSFIKHVNSLLFKSEYHITDIPLFAQNVHVRSESVTAKIENLEIAFSPQVHIETPPQDIEACIESMEMEIEEAETKDAAVRSFNTIITSSPVALPVKKEVKAVTFKAISASIKKAVMQSIETASKDGMLLLDSLPFLRTSLSIYAMPADTRVGYWKELISQVQKQPKELELLGIFPNVPTKGVSKASLDPANNQLKLWCTPEARRSPSATLLIAKEREDGKIYRVYDRRTLPDRTLQS